MLDSIRRFFDRHLVAEAATEDAEHRLRLACAALLIEVARADYATPAEELAVVGRAVRETFGLSSAETVELLRLAEEEADNVTSYHEFTALINKHYTKQEKIRLVSLMWQVVFADAKLQKYEEHLVRKLADLLYVPHSEFIAAKLRAQAQRDGSG